MVNNLATEVPAVEVYHHRAKGTAYIFDLVVSNLLPGTIFYAQLSIVLISSTIPVFSCFSFSNFKCDRLPRPIFSHACVI